MRAKSLFRLLIVFSLVVVLGCDKVEEPFKLNSSFPGVYDSNLPIRKILLEDYTGFKCINCPRAAEKIHSLKDSYGGHVVPVSIHFGFFATPSSAEDPDFITPEGTEIGIAFDLDPDITPLPIGIINRKMYDDSYEVVYEDWSTKVTDILKVNHFADIGIEIITDYNESDSTSDITIQSTVINSLSGKLFMSVIVTESHIFGKQKDGSVILPDYEHNHVLRGVVNGSWGEELAGNGVTSGDIINMTFEDFQINNNWNPDNLSIIAIIYDSESMEVIQVEEHELISE